jgi:hypothetical protein
MHSRARLGARLDHAPRARGAAARKGVQGARGVGAGTGARDLPGRMVSQCDLPVALPDWAPMRIP